MASIALNRENYILHRIHSITGIVPVGYYMAQHLLLNTFSLGGPEKFNGVIDFFEGMPRHFLLAMEVCMIWLPLAFHAVYGLFIVGRAQPNFIGTKYGWSQNRMYLLQRWSGMFVFLFLCIHVATTTGVKYFRDDASLVKFAAWETKLTEHGYIWLIFYLLGVLAASYHLAYGIWNFCIRWGITISDKAQQQVQKLSLVVFFGLTLMGWLALAGFLMPHGSANQPGVQSASIQTPTHLG